MSGRRKDGVGGKLGLHRLAGRRTAQLAPAAAFTAWQSVMRDSSRNCLVPRRGLVMISTAPYSSALKRALRALLGQARADHHRNRMLAHDLLQECQPVHARHLDIEGDDVRHLFCDSVRGNKWIACRGDDLDLRILTKALRSASGAPRRSRPRSAREFWVAHHSLRDLCQPAGNALLVRELPRIQPDAAAADSTSPVSVLN